MTKDRLIQELKVALESSIEMMAMPDKEFERHCVILISTVPEPPFNVELATAIALDSPFVTYLANEFEVAESTVRRWLDGTATPHPDLQAQILAFASGPINPPTSDKDRERREERDEDERRDVT